MRRLLWTAVALIVSYSAFADEVHLKNGNKIVGKVTEDGDKIKVTKANGITVSIPRSDVEKIVYTKDDPPEPKPAPPDSPAAPQDPRRGSWDAELRAATSMADKAGLAISGDRVLVAGEGVCLLNRTTGERAGASDLKWAVGPNVGFLGDALVGTRNVFDPKTGKSLREHQIIRACGAPSGGGYTITHIPKPQVAKLNPSGKVLWTTDLGDSQWEQVFAIPGGVLVRSTESSASAIKVSDTGKIQWTFHPNLPSGTFEGSRWWILDVPGKTVLVVVSYLRGSGRFDRSAQVDVVTDGKANTLAVANGAQLNTASSEPFVFNRGTNWYLAVIAQQLDSGDVSNWIVAVDLQKCSELTRTRTRGMNLFKSGYLSDVEGATTDLVSGRAIQGLSLKGADFGTQDYAVDLRAPESKLIAYDGSTRRDISLPVPDAQIFYPASRHAACPGALLFWGRDAKDETKPLVLGVVDLKAGTARVVHRYEGEEIKPNTVAASTDQIFAVLAHRKTTKDIVLRLSVTRVR